MERNKITEKPEIDIRKYPFESFTSLYNKFEWDIPTMFNIGEAICDRHADNKARIAILYEDDEGNENKYTFWDLKNKSNQLANFLNELGVEPKERVGILLAERPETIASFVAVYKLGGIVLSMSPLFGQDAVQYRLKDSNTKILIIEAGRKDIRQIAEKIPSLQHVIIVGEGDPSGQKEQSYDEIKNISTDYEYPQTPSENPAHMFYTSGTTGPPKGTLHAHRFILGHIPSFQLYFELAPQDRDVFWTPADWGWIGALGDVIFPALYFGMPIVAHRRRGPFDPLKTLELMEKHQITCAFIPPTALRMIRKTIDHPSKEYDLSLRAISSAGESVSSDLKKWGRKALGVPINEFYGATEDNLIVVTCSAFMDGQSGAMGKPSPGQVVEVLDKEGNILPIGEIGGIGVKSPNPVLFLEYWNNAEATKQKFKGVWFMMGDLGYKDENGYLWFKARADDLIKQAGYRIGPSEVEAIINSHPAVLESGVIPKPDPIRGHKIKAFIVIKNKFQPNKELKKEIQFLVKNKLATYAYPREIEFIKELPKTVTGKIMRYELRKLL